MNRAQFLRHMALDGKPEVESQVSITYPVWKQFGSQLDWLQGFSPHVRVGISRTPGRPAGAEETDRWGCHWHYPLEALDGLCVGHPIPSWKALKDYRPPDPELYTDWEQARRTVAQAHERGEVAWGGTDHGFLFLRLSYLRGFAEFMLDLAEERPELMELIERVEGYWTGVADRWVELGVDAIGFGDDLGLQHALPISPAAWRRYIAPAYTRIFSHCRSRGVHVSLHTDGYIVDIIPDLIACGISMLNPQDLVNGLDTLRRLARGKIVLQLDIDRQDITVFGTPEQARLHVQRCIQTLGSPHGGLNLIWGVYPGTPLANIEAVVRTMDQYAAWWRDRPGEE